MRLLPCLLLLLAPPACRRPAPPPKAVPVATDAALELTVASFNIRYENPAERDWRAWSNRLDRVVRSIRAIDPDVLGIQEALHGQAADLRASLPDYDFQGVGRDDGRRAGEYSAILYRRDRFEWSDGGTFWLSDTPERPGSMSWGNGIPRLATWVRLIDRASGRAFHLYNTHWDHRSQRSREFAAPLIAQRIDARANPAEPLVLLGDFNATEGNPAVDYFTGKSVTLAGRRLPAWPNALVDSYQTLHPDVKNRRTLHFWEGHRAGWAKVDHILASRGVEVAAADIRVEPTREQQPSDHFPVWAKLRWPPPAPSSLPPR
jgi:endonuclease/exonuclease/phosphatase family metal-dependent hydrolase